MLLLLKANRNETQNIAFVESEFSNFQTMSKIRKYQKYLFLEKSKN